jgi:DNA repair protein RadC
MPTMTKTTETKPVRIPRFRVTLVREGSTEAPMGRTVREPADVAAMLRTIADELDREHTLAVLLDTRNRVIGINTVSVGTLNSTLVHPREVFKPAILANAASIILAHNHPSGDATPSSEDLALTQRMAQAGEILGIRVLDHLVLGEHGTFTAIMEAAR